MLHLSKMEFSELIKDEFIKWEPYTEVENLCIRFSSDEWHKIVSDVHSDNEWCNFIKENADFIRCYILKCHKDNRPIAFVYTLNEYIDKKVISIHGGGWNSPLLYYRGYVLILKTLLENGYKIRTYCSLNNHKVLRISKGIGYVVYKKTETEVHMWLSLYNLKRSKVFKYFYSK